MCIFNRKRLYCILYALLVIGLIKGGFDTDLYAGVLIPENLEIQKDFQPGIGAPVGKIQLIQGETVIIHAEDLLRGYMAQQGHPLFKGDIIITKEKGRIRLELNDGSEMTMASETRLEINQSIYDPEKETRSSFLSMSIGKARFLIKKLADFKRSDVKVKTNTAIVGVRGSDFIIVATDTSTEVTALEKTDLEVVSLVSPETAPVMLKDFERTEIEADKLPSEPVDIPVEDIEIMKKDLTITQEIAVPEAETFEIKEHVIVEPVAPFEDGILVSDDELVKPEEIGEPEKPEKIITPYIAVEKEKPNKQDDVEKISDDQREEEWRSLPDFPNPPKD